MGYHPKACRERDCADFYMVITSDKKKKPPDFVKNQVTM